jgi:hypothetical protein
MFHLACAHRRFKEQTVQQQGANPPRRICKDASPGKIASKTKAPLFSSADRHGRVQRRVGRQLPQYTFLNIP